MERVSLLGFPIDTYNIENALEHKGQVVTINPEMIDYALQHPEYAEIIKNAELIIPDGIGIELGLKILGFNVKRIAGIEFAKRLIIKYKGEPAAFVGAKPDILEKAVGNLKSEIPELNVIYKHDGYYDNEEEILSQTAEKKPVLVLVAMGAPKQEEFIYKLKTRLPDAVMIGVGGSFDVWANEVERAPEIYQKLGLEWLYRTIKDPKRFKRIFPALPLFVLRVFKEKLTC